MEVLEPPELQAFGGGRVDPGDLRLPVAGRRGDRHQPPAVVSARARRDRGHGPAGPFQRVAQRPGVLGQRLRARRLLVRQQLHPGHGAAEQPGGLVPRAGAPDHQGRRVRSRGAGQPDGRAGDLAAHVAAPDRAVPELFEHVLRRTSAPRFDRARGTQPQPPQHRPRQVAHQRVRLLADDGHPLDPVQVEALGEAGTARGEPAAQDAGHGRFEPRQRRARPHQAVQAVGERVGVLHVVDPEPPQDLHQFGVPVLRDEFGRPLGRGQDPVQRVGSADDVAIGTVPVGHRPGDRRDVGEQLEQLEGVLLVQLLVELRLRGVGGGFGGGVVAEEPALQRGAVRHAARGHQVGELDPVGVAGLLRAGLLQPQDRLARRHLRVDVHVDLADDAVPRGGQRRFELHALQHGQHVTGRDAVARRRAKPDHQRRERRGDHAAAAVGHAVGAAVDRHLHRVVQRDQGGRHPLVPDQHQPLPGGLADRAHGHGPVRCDDLPGGSPEPPHAEPGGDPAERQVDLVGRLGHQFGAAAGRRGEQVLAEVVPPGLGEGHRDQDQRDGGAVLDQGASAGHEPVDERGVGAALPDLRPGEQRPQESQRGGAVAHHQPGLLDSPAEPGQRLLPGRAPGDDLHE